MPRKKAEPKVESKGGFVPYVPADKTVPELTIKAVLVGAFLAVILGATNVYAGLLAGITVSASIPAAVIAIAVFRGVFKGTILENNIVQTITSAGESLAAGVIFTIPALVILGLWTDFHYWTVTLIAMLGGIMGVLFMVPLRRSLMVKTAELPYPEGIACAEVLKVGETMGRGAKYMFSALGIAALYTYIQRGLGYMAGTLEGATSIGKGVAYGGCDVNPVLLGIGYILGPKIAAVIFMGGAIAWLGFLPIYTAIWGLPAEIAGASALDAAWWMWSCKIRYMGVGAMIVGGIWSIISVRHGLVEAIRTVTGFKIEKPREIIRTERDLPINYMIAGALILAIPIFFLYWYLTGSGTISVVATIAMIIMGFFFVAVSSYIVGIVGSTGNPVSGMTICTLLFSCALLLLFGMKGYPGMAAALGVAGVVCCAACTAGDISQDLKTGYLVGATPWKQQSMQFIGVISSAFIMAPVLTMLHKAYGIGTGLPGSLPAPQAGLMAGVVEGMFMGGLPWDMVALGVIIGIVLIILKLPVMACAVGIYLPIGMSVPILLGGLTHLAVDRVVKPKGPEARTDATHRGILTGSGMVAGGALMGIIIAWFACGEISLAGPAWPMWAIRALSLVCFAGLIGLLAYVSLKGKALKTK